MRKTLTVAIAAITLATGAITPAMAYPAGIQKAVAVPGQDLRIDVQYRGCYRGERPRDCRERLRYERRHGRRYEWRDNRYYDNRRSDNDGAALAAGIIGFALGAAIVGSQADQTRYSSRRNNQAWLRSCRQRYRSFDARTGTYLGYDGYRHYCR